MANKKDDKIVKLEKKQTKKAVQDFGGFISKIKFKKEVPEIKYKSNGRKSSKDTTVKGRERPLDSFLAAMQDLKEYFVEVCEIENKMENTIITGVSFSEKGVVITGQYELLNNKQKIQMPLNTPLIRYEAQKGLKVPQEVEELLEKLKFEAIQYINGEYAEKQISFLEEAK